MLTRRGIIGGLGALLAAPAVVKAASLMPVRGIIMPYEGNLITLEEYAKGFSKYDMIKPAIEMFCSYSEIFEIVPLRPFEPIRNVMLPPRFMPINGPSTTL